MIPLYPEDTAVRPRFARGVRAVSLVILAAIALPASAQNPAVTVSVDASQNRRPINPLIYGVAYANQAAMVDLNVPVNRMGGNNTSRYNWKLNADNRGNDWFFESIPDASSVPGDRIDTFIQNSKQMQVQPMVTIPMIDWIAKLGSNRSKLASFLVSKYGAQQKVDSWWTNAGNGVTSSGTIIKGNNPADANVSNSTAFQQEWVRSIVAKWGAAANGGLRYYILDNEPGIWHGTHRDVRPNGVTMDELRDKTIAYAKAIKEVDSTAMVVGPEEWGWTNYLYSGSDAQYGSAHGWGYLPDRAAHGNMDIMPWLLDQLRQAGDAGGRRLLDVFTLHYYPQGGEFWGGTDTTTQLMRNRSTRSLWDPNYVDQSWINARVQLIPRMKSWVNAYYPGTQTGITEYNWGAEGHINGATTQADIWGIFGREGLDMAARWTTPGAATPTYKAMKLYRNYDGDMSGFGDTSVSAVAPNPDNLSAFAASRSVDGALTIIIVNKVLSGSTPVTVNLSGFTSNGLAQVWQLTSTNTITRLADAAASTTVSLTVPPQSVTLLALPAASGVTPPAVPTNLAATPGDSQVTLAWTASTGATAYRVKRSTTAGSGYTTVKSGVTDPGYTDSNVTNGTKYYYVVTAANAGGESGYSNEASATPVPAAGTAFRINSAGPAYNGTSGVFSADQYFTSGATADRGNISIANTSDPTLYTTLRYSTRFGYSIAMANGPYTVTLHFAETGYNAAGYRRFNVSVNGSAWLSALDVWTESGGFGKALTKSTTVTVANGKLDLSFASVNTNNAFVNAVEIVPYDSTSPPANPPAAPSSLSAKAGDKQVSLTWTASAGATSYNVKRSTTAGSGYAAVKSGLATASYTDAGLTNGTKYYYVVTAVNAGGESGNSNEASATPTPPPGTTVRVNSAGPLYSGTLGVFSADKYFTSGATTDRGAITIGNTSAPALYRTLRYGTTFGYSVPVTNGTYKVTLHFAETYYKTTSARKFNVTLNGAAWLSKLDVFAAAGYSKALTKTQTVTVTGGKINIGFAVTTGPNAFVNAIEVVPSP